MYNKKKVERKFTHMPQPWCIDICCNAMNEDCIEKCAPKRDTSAFVLKKDITLQDLPPFPQSAWQNDMTGAERKAVAGVYLAKITERLQGREQTVWSRSTRPDTVGIRNGRK